MPIDLYDAAGIQPAKSGAVDLYEASGEKTPPPKFDLKRWAGLEARNLVHGVTALPQMVMNAEGGLYNAAANALQGKIVNPQPYDQQHPGPSLRDFIAGNQNAKDFRFRTAGENINQMMTNAGAPVPATPGENIGSLVAQGASGGGGAPMLARGLAAISKSAPGLLSAARPGLQSMAQSMAANPIKQLVGGVTGAASAEGARQLGAPLPLQMAAGFAGGLTPFGVPAIAQTAARVANRGVSALSGGDIQLLNPASEAESRIREAFLTDGGPQAAAQIAASHARSGASTPSLLDVGGASVKRLMRAAAGGGGEANNIATQYANQVRADLQDQASAAIDRLHPERRTAHQGEAQFEGDQRALATEQYREPYSQPATVNRQMVSALEGPEGQRVIRAALSDASANRDHTAMAELRDLLDVATQQGGGQNPLTGRMQSLQQALETLSAGSLDRVRIATRETARGLAAAGRNYRAGGYYGRMADIDTALDQTPGLTDARANYRQMQQQRDAIPHGQEILSMPGDEYAAGVQNLSGVGGPPNVGAGLRIGARQALRDAVRSPAAGQTGILNRIASGTSVGENLSNTFGLGRTAVFREAIRNEVNRLRNANFIAPESGSQTQLRGTDEGLLSGFPTSVQSLMSKVADKFLRGVSLSPQERAEIVRLGTSEADLRRFVTARPMQARPTVAASQAAITQGNNQ